MQLRREDMSVNPKNEMLVKATEAQYKVTGKRFCSSCQNLRPLDGGEIVGQKTKRWKCAICFNKGAVRKYQRVAKKQED